MKLRQLISLVICTLALYVMGNMALTLLPVYTVKLGMDDDAIGIYLGLAFASITVGALSSSWFSDRFQRRKLTIIVISIIGIPATFLMGQVSSLFLLTVCTLIVWFAAGLATATLNILTGLYAAPDERGRIFGILASAIALGSALGGFAAGTIVDHWGYAALYIVTALVWLIPIAASLFIRDDITTRPPIGQPKPASMRLSRALWLLLIANVLVAATGFSGGFARPLIMNGLSFDATSISSAVTISSLMTLPLPFLVGWLSDRVGRKQLLIASYVISAVAMLMLISAHDLWQFWLSASLFSVAGGTGGVAGALVTDLATPEALSTALSRFSATGWIGGILGYTVTGLIIRPLGLTTTLLIGAALPLFAILALVSIRKNARLAPV